MIMELFFWMDKYSLFNFIQCSKCIYQLFDSVMATSLTQIRLNYLNKKVKHVMTRPIPPRLIEVFSNNNLNNKNVMLTYDDYFHQKSASSWPSSYFYNAHDHKQTIISKLDAKELVKNQDQEIPRSAVTSLPTYTAKEEAEYSTKEILQTMVFPYGMFPQKDTYELTFDDYVKRKINFSYLNEPGPFAMDQSKKEFVITETLYDCIQYADHNVDYHFYSDSMNRSLRTPFCERIVRFFKHPHEMTLQDFDHRFKNDILKEIAKILVYDCAFEHNKTTTTQERFVVAGGSLLHTLTGCGCGDIDIFVMCNGEDEKTTVSSAIKSLLLKFESLTHHLKYNIMKSKTTINICSDGHSMNTQYQVSADPNYNIQIVLLKFETIEELLAFFDLDCCRFAYDGSKLYTFLEGLRSLKYKLNILPLETSNGEINRKRAEKYGKRGFFTLSLPTFHPLSHEMHNDFMIEAIRSEMIEKYSQRYLHDRHSPSYSFFQRIGNPCEKYFVHPTFYHISPLVGGLSMDLDESCYLYPIVLRNASYTLIDLCRKFGLETALRILLPCLERHKGYYSIDASRMNQTMSNLDAVLMSSEKHDLLHERMNEILQKDAYLFVEKPSELFSAMNQQDQILLSTRYSDRHLQNKYRILKCQECEKYEYSPSKCSLLEAHKHQKDLEFWNIAREHPEVMKWATQREEHSHLVDEEENHHDQAFIARRDYLPKEHFLCKSCEIELEIAKEIENFPCHAANVIF
ncbi:hypothetical protein C9374_010719 [Naegleria lovaniensis]|uniref:Uncharacterized protein n=1 Tax=Naegleria lovaniensis TaxID=51637 RepID=A0AA88KD53_NAELO|nr:uncharacterized protein C9374_010719 [Naegleria lovaniensis]KAG2374435.1 hypothetical protein C9374_010719 [Naegleria lovaniensis]